MLNYHELASNIRTSHLSCNKSRGKRDLAQYRLTCNSRSDAWRTHGVVHALLTKGRE